MFLYLFVHKLESGQEFAFSAASHNALIALPVISINVAKGAQRSSVTRRALLTNLNFLFKLAIEVLLDATVHQRAFTSKKLELTQFDSKQES